MKIEAYAKINLTLEVLGKRPDGYHELKSIVCPVSLSDSLTVEKALETSSNTPFADDLCVKAAKVMGLGAKISVEKRIPTGGGLGGGSADAAAVMIALNEIYGLGLSPDKLAEKGSLVGSDVPSLILANIFSSAVLMEGRGERVRPLAKAKLNFVLVDPAVHSSTAEVFSKWKDIGVPSKISEPSLAAEDALSSGDIEALSKVISNDLSLPSSFLHPEISNALDMLSRENVLAASVTGSGSCVFALVSSNEEAIRITQALRLKGVRAFAISSLS